MEKHSIHELLKASVNSDAKQTGNAGYQEAEIDVSKTVSSDKSHTVFESSVEDVFGNEDQAGENDNNRRVAARLRKKDDRAETRNNVRVGKPELGNTDASLSDGLATDDDDEVDSASSAAAVISASDKAKEAREEKAKRKAQTAADKAAATPAPAATETAASGQDSGSASASSPSSGWR